jgi:TM2 domain-containing membrane protein YozV
MKKLLFILIALMTVSTVIYASFPVTEDNTVLVDSNNQPIEAPAPSVDWGLFLVCFFVGPLGIHRFMMGDTTNGILMLLTGGGCLIWAFIDLIRILMGDMSR